MDLKAQVLENYVRIEELPSHGCFKTYSVCDDPNILSCIEFRFKEYTERTQSCSISIQVDKLLGRWLKIKQFINFPTDQRIIAILALQPIWLNYYFEIWINEQPSRSYYCLLKPQPFYQIAGGAHLSVQQHLLGPRNTAFSYLDPRFPFVFVEFMTESERSNNLTVKDLIVKCNSVSRRIHSLPTSNPRVHLLIFSDVLETKKDCKKIMRKYLKTPNHPVWTKYDLVGQYLIKYLSLSEYGLRFTSFHHKYGGLEFDRYDNDSAIVKLGDKVSSRIQDDLLLQTYFNTDSATVARSKIYYELDYAQE